MIISAMATLALLRHMALAHAAADPITAELNLQTQRLADIVRDGAEEAGPWGAPIMISTKCGHHREWWTGRCGDNEASVPFLTDGPGTAVWQYVALFRLLPKKSAFEAEARKTLGQRARHVALMTFVFIPEPFGIVDWTTAHAEAGHVIVQTHHWVDGDGHANPSKLGTIRIDYEGGLRLTNRP